MTIALSTIYIKKTPFWANSFELVNLRDLQASSFLEKWFPTFSFSTFSCASVPVSVRERRRKKESNPWVIFVISELRDFQREYPDEGGTYCSLIWSGDWRERQRLECCPVSVWKATSPNHLVLEAALFILSWRADTVRWVFSVFPRGAKCRPRVNISDMESRVQCLKTIQCIVGAEI